MTLPLQSSSPAQQLIQQDDNIVRLRTRFARHFLHVLETLQLGGVAPEKSMSLSEWSAAETFPWLLSHYRRFIYRHHSDAPAQQKALLSFWAQWYLGLLLPPMLLAVLPQMKMIDCSHHRWRVSVKDSGQPAAFWWDIREVDEGDTLSARARIELIIHQHLIPVTAAITKQGGISERLIWCNTGMLLHWFLTASADIPSMPCTKTLMEDIFLIRHLSDGHDNPFFHTLRQQAGALQRRTCCLRYQLPDIAPCETCPKKYCQPR
ncbi:MAG: Ferric iron reductase protein FhuF [Candidatus Erwinia impunctatus]|nr:Ferric iron reductase protein FhuF [Culicoides impunctatus]